MIQIEGGLVPGAGQNTIGGGLHRVDNVVQGEGVLGEESGDLGYRRAPGAEVTARCA